MEELSNDYKLQIQRLVEDIKTQGYENICFFQPGYSIMGAAYCEILLAEYLANSTELNIYFCDFIDGYGHRLLQEYEDTKVKFLKYEPNVISFPLNEKTIFLTSSIRVILLRKMHNENKIVLWHNETTPCAWNLIFIRNEMMNFFKLLEKTDSIMFHDWSSRDSLNRYSKTNFKNSDFFYVPVVHKKVCANSKFIENNSINIAFLSRLSSDKIQSLFYLVKNLYELSLIKKIKIHVIGDGICKEFVVRTLTKYEDKLEIIYCGSILHENLDEYLVNNIDLLYGVGTSVVEAAALKIPSAILLMSYNEIKDNEAFWYFDTKDYCVGITKDQKEDFKIEYTTIQKQVEQVCAIDGKKYLGERSYQYFVENHGNLDKLAYNFLNQLSKSFLTFKMLKKCIKYIPYAFLKIAHLKIMKCLKFEKINFGSKVEFYFFCIKFLKIKKKGLVTKFYLLGIKIAEFTQKETYKFKNSMRKEKI